MWTVSLDDDDAMSCGIWIRVEVNTDVTEIKTGLHKPLRQSLCKRMDVNSGFLDVYLRLRLKISTY